MKKIYEMMFHGRKIVVETGELAKQADGAVLVRYGDTAVLSTAVAGNIPTSLDYFPLSVTYQEKLYAAGKIPGSFLRREGRETEHATLIGRLIDRPIRPLFADGFRNEVQVINTVLSADFDCTPEMTAMFGSSLSLTISDIPFEGPIAGVQVGRVDGTFIINPTTEENAKSDLQLTVAGTKNAINMVEAGANEVSEEDMLEALMLGHEAIKELCAFQAEIQKDIGVAKREFPLFVPDQELVQALKEKYTGKLQEAISVFDKLERSAAIEAVKAEMVEDYEAQDYESDNDKRRTVSDVKALHEVMVSEEIRRLITHEKVRPDGRKVDEIRPLDSQVDLLPRTHGSALFTRGQTQVLSVVTLGPKSDEQIIDNLTDEESRRFMHHYNFPPFSVGEIKKLGNPARREIGHGALGERALLAVIPSEEDFPYTIRVVSEVLESNGSSSQASICASSMALMAAGVPIKDMVSGIAMGLITSGPLDGKHPYTILTDIQGLEDHFGDMDFKVAGTSKGITALQMDIKVRGISKEVLAESLAQAKKAREEIRANQMTAISAPREDVAQYAPKMAKMYVPVDKIREVIGSGGKVINKIIEENDNAKIDIDDNGLVVVYHMNRETINNVIATIEAIVKEAKVGEIYEGKVTRVEPYGVFVNLFGNVDALVHVSDLDWAYVDDATKLYKLGEVLKVKVTGVDEKGKVKASVKVFKPKPEGYIERRGGGRRNDKK
ncbi:MAG: Polyribonucleotide nucleotidyltransferase [Tenericutes bacterium ADurb.Bin239]|nr:MAG: Polyribonucleotide nucleotidyltransferase [Tenericutes bacterium ADurb.Bin239]